MKKFKLFVSIFMLALFSSSLAGCTYYVSAVYIREAKKSPGFETILKDPDAYKGAVVVWGGEIVETINKKDSSEIIIVQMPLDVAKMPQRIKASLGRFIAIAPHFLDPAIYKEGKRIVIAGEILGAETRPLGGIEYKYPLVQIKDMYLFSRLSYAGPVYYYGLGGPFRAGYWNYDYWYYE